MIDRIRELSTYSEESCCRISVENIKKISIEHRTPGREIEILALENEIAPERYIRNMKSFSFDDQATLLKSRVAVVGLGGLGGTVAEILARTGVGTLDIVDGDVFEDSNLNRQLISREDQIGSKKSKSAKARINGINSSVEVLEHGDFLTLENGVELVGKASVIVDCLDNVKTRFALETVSKRIGVPLVSAAVAGSSGRVMTIFPKDKGLRSVYGDLESLGENGAEKFLGCLPFTVTALASIECSEVVKIILNKGLVLRNKFLALDLSDNTMEIMILR